MQIIDIDCFVGYLDPEKAMPKFTAGMLKKKMDCYGVSHGVVYDKEAVNAPMRGNESTRKLAAESGGRFSACYVLSPDLGSRQMPAAEELFKKLQQERPAAVRLFPSKGFFQLDAFYCSELLDVLSQLSVPLLLEGEELSRNLDIPKLSEQYPSLPIVLLHFGLRMSRTIRPLVSKRKNVYFDVSKMIDTGFLDEMVERCGSEKFLFGSGMPYMDPTGPLALVLYGRFSSEHKENILSQNWNRMQEAIRWE